MFNPLNAELNPICHLLVLLGAHPILHISRIREYSVLIFVEKIYEMQHVESSGTHILYIGRTVFRG
jgi:hypothetical protein